MSTRVVAVINPASGQDEPMLSALSDVLGASGVEWAVRVTTGEGDALRFAREAREENAGVVLAYGGDGTIADVATALAGSDTPLAILPGGTGNAVAQELGIPRDLRAAVELAVAPDARIEGIDCLRVGERCFLLRVGVGADARVVGGAERADKDRLGWLAYLLSAVGQLRNPERAAYRVDLDGVEMEFEAVSVILANIGRLGRAGLRLADDVLPNDGHMDVLVVRDAEPASVLSVGASLLGFSTLPEAPGELEEAPLYRWRAQRVSVTASPEQEVHGDGDILGTTPCEVWLDPGAVRIVLPG